MICTVDVEIQAANPDFPLKEWKAFKGSPTSIRIRNVPRKVGAWEIGVVRVKAVYPDNTAHEVSAVLSGCVWVATIPASEAVGYVEGGYSIEADGTDENGNAVTGYRLGEGKVTIYDVAVSAHAVDGVEFMRLVDTKPSNPRKGDFALDTMEMYDGAEWRSFSEPADYATVRTNAETGAAHAAVTSGNPHRTTFASLTDKPSVFPPETVSDLNTRPETRGKAADAQDVYDKLEGKRGVDDMLWVKYSPSEWAATNMTVNIESRFSAAMVHEECIIRGEYKLSKVEGEELWRFENDDFILDLLYIDNKHTAVVFSIQWKKYYISKYEDKYYHPNLMVWYNVYGDELFRDTPQQISCKRISDDMDGMVVFGSFSLKVDMTPERSMEFAFDIDLADKLTDADLKTLCTACGISLTRPDGTQKTRAELLTDLFGETNSQMVATIEDKAVIFLRYSGDFIYKGEVAEANKITKFSELAAIVKTGRAVLQATATSASGSSPVLFRPHMINDGTGAQAANILFDATGTIDEGIYTRCIRASKKAGTTDELMVQGGNQRERLAKYSDISESNANFVAAVTACFDNADTTSYGGQN